MAWPPRPTIDDTLTGGAGTDLLEGGVGNDTLQWTAEGTWNGYNAYNVDTGDLVPLTGLTKNSDIFDGGDGNDTLVGTDQGDAIFLDNSFSPTYTAGDAARLASIENVELGGGDDILDMTSNLYTYNTDMTVHGGEGDDVVWTTLGNDTLYGEAGADRMHAGDGGDTLVGGAGDDVLHGGDGSDLFLFSEGDGADTIDGGAGGGWTDVIQLSDAGGGSDLGVFGTDWTLTLSEGSINTQDADSITLTDDADGTITLQDGSTIDFTDIERIDF